LGMTSFWIPAPGYVDDGNVWPPAWVPQVDLLALWRGDHARTRTSRSTPTTAFTTKPLPSTRGSYARPARKDRHRTGKRRHVAVSGVVQVRSQPRGRSVVISIRRGR
jgi:hypothetical protein